MARCENYFGYSGGQGRLVDQPFEPRIIEGLIDVWSGSAVSTPPAGRAAPFG